MTKHNYDMKRNLILLGSLLFCATLQAQDFATGVVYNDANQNGKRERSEKGIAQVAVSNGVHVVHTNNKGEYKLPLSNDNILFVIKPRDYKLPVNENNQPQFYYIHKPIGSPDLKYKGSSPTGPLPKSVDFALQASPESDKFKAYIFGDPQAYNLDEIEYFRKGIVKDIQDKENILFGLSLGDLVGDNLSLHQPYIHAVSEIGLPWFNVIGNHDMDFDVTVDSLSDETFEQNFGPANYAFNYGNAHIIVLDNILYPNPRTQKGYLGGFRKDQLDFVENNLKLVPKDKLIVLAFHIPLKHRNSDVFRNEDRQRLFDLLSPYPNTVSMSAHTHYQTQNFYGKEDGWKQEKPHHEYNVGTTSGDWYSGQYNAQEVPASTMRDGTPKGYAIMTVDGNNYSFDYKVAGEDSDYQIKLTFPTEVSEKHIRRYRFYANVFMGTKDDKVEYRINNGKWQNMTSVLIPDPSYQYEVAKFDNADKFIDGRRPSDPVNSTHLWEARLSKLEKGQHTLEVRSKDMFGKILQATKVINVR